MLRQDPVDCNSSWQCGRRL
jgi:NADPH-dependent curcumin reductase CurA